jgi:hypothetical protein
MCAKCVRSHSMREGADKEVSLRPSGKKTNLCRRGVVARDGCERAASSLHRFTTPHPTPEEGPPVGIEWEVGLPQKRTGQWECHGKLYKCKWECWIEIWRSSCNLLHSYSNLVKCRYLHNCCWGCESDNVRGRHNGQGCRARG